MDASAAYVRGTTAGSARAEGDSLPSLTATDAAFVDALRTVLAGDSGAATRPGQLRQKIDAALGPEQAAGLRPLVHQVVAAAEENLPGYLTRIMPLTARSLQQLSGELATARGWNDATAQRVTQIWACALGFGAVAEDWPQQQEPPAAPVAAPAHTAGQADRPTDATSLPPPPTENRAAGATPPPVSSGTGTDWPAPSRLARGHAASRAGQPVLGATWAYAGMSLKVYLLIVGLVVALMVASFVAFHVLVGALPLLALAYFLRRAVARGLLVATASGLEFTAYTAFLSKPRADGGFSAAWSEVTVDEGAFTELRLAGRRLQVGPLSRQFARASAAHAGRGA